MRGWHAKGNGLEATGFYRSITAGSDKCFITTTPLPGDSSGQHMTYMFAQIGRQLEAVELPDDLQEVKEAAQEGICFICAAQQRRAVGEAAAELSRLYGVFDKAAVDLTNEYVNQRLAGEEGDTWGMFPGLFSHEVPYLDTVMRHKGAILLAPAYDFYWEMYYRYRLSKVEMLAPIADETFGRVSVIVVRRAGAGFDSGDEYIVIGDQVLKAGHDHHGSMPTVGPHGGLAWSTPRDFINGTFRALTKVDADLEKVVERLRTYEPAEDSSAE